jgi:hypothetical protein
MRPDFRHRRRFQRDDMADPVTNESWRRERSTLL